MEVEIHRFEVATGRRRDERIVGEALILLHLAHIQEPGRIDGAGLQILEDGVQIDVAEDDLVQVGQPFAGTVVAGIAYQRVMLAGDALRHHERAARDLGVQVVGRLLDGLRCHPAEVMRGQWRIDTIYPQRDKWRIGSREVEGDREVVRRNIC